MRERSPRTLLLLLLALVALAAATRITGVGPLAASPPPSADTPAATTTAAPTPNATTPPGAAPTTSATTPATTGTTPATAPAPRPEDTAAASAGTVAPDRTPGAPLRGALTAPHLPDFERANVALANLEHAIDAPIRPMARTAHRACARLDDDIPLLAALRNTCRDTIVAAKLSRVLSRRCADTTDACARTAARLADAASSLVDARRAYAKTIRRTIAPNACRTALLPTHDDLASERRLAHALRGVADAAAARDLEALATAGRRLTRTAQRSTTDGRTATAVITELRAACALPRYPDPIE
jgi:hypothetical protein